MFTDTLMMAQDQAMVLAQGGGNVLNIQFDQKLVDFCKKLAGFLVLAWIAYLLGTNLLPSKGGGGMQAMMGGGGGGGKIFLALVGIICLLDIQITVNIANFVIEQLISFKNSVF